MGVAENLKRAARFNPAWRPARIFKVATDEAGEALSDDTGTFIYDQSEGDTFGRVLYEQDDRAWLAETPWQGRATICVITCNPPDPNCMIDLSGTFYQVLEVASGDATGATVHYRATAIPTLKVPTIRGQQ